MIPMTEPMALLEPTFSAAMTPIAASAALSAGIKRHWGCSLRQLATWLARRSLWATWGDDGVAAVYLRDRAETSSLATNSMAWRSLARAWNAFADENPDWPSRRLTEPPLKAKEGPAWDEFPEGLRRDIDK